jgi:hypothetical protein
VNALTAEQLALCEALKMRDSLAAFRAARSAILRDAPNAHALWHDEKIVGLEQLLGAPQLQPEPERAAAAVVAPQPPQRTVLPRRKRETAGERHLRIYLTNAHEAAH